VGESIGRGVAVWLAISIAGVLDGAIVGLGAGGALQLLINPSMKISKNEVFMRSSPIVEPQQSVIRIILYGGDFADP
jgi:hypothetical protein